VLARLLTSTRATKTAIELLDETPAQQKASLAVLVERNWIYGALGNTGEMEKGVQQGLAVQRTPDLLVQEALLQLGRKDFSGAQVSAEEALHSSPEDIRALEVMSGAYVGQNSEAGAAKVQEYVARQPQSATVQLFFGKWLEARGDLKGARAALTAAHTANSDSPDAELALAQLDLLETKWKEARQKIAAVLARNSENITARYWLAQVEEVEGNHNASIEQYRKVVATDPSNATALNNLAFLLSEKADQPGEALPLAQRAKELSPDNAAVTDTLGWVLYRNGLYSLAARNLEDAIAHQSTARRISHLSMAYAKLGATDRARHMLETALKMDPTLPEVKQAQDLLEKPVPGKRAGS
jgi:Tfp pilus assembly protein PilF